MELSAKTEAFLANFAKINQNMLFLEGNTIKTMSEARNVLASANIEENIPKEIVNLGHEIIIQKYPVGFEFKPHIDDVLSKDKKTIKRIRHYTILMQLSEKNEYKGGDLFIKTDKENKVSKEIGTVSIFSQGIIHWVNPITDGERWSATIFLERTALEKDLL